MFHTAMSRFEARIAEARPQLEDRSKAFPSFTSEQLGFTQEQALAFMQYQQSRPENQARRAMDRIERKLVDAGLVTADPERTILNDLFERWKRERQPKQKSVE